MPILDFTSRVLGREAVEQLRAKCITQTIRSVKSGSRFFTSRGSTVSVVLDESETIGQARISEVKTISFRDLNDFDAEIGGFSDFIELIMALQRAGFRFKPLRQYNGIKIGFTWLKGVT